MFYGVSHVDLQVARLARAKAFYGETLGFEVLDEGEGWVDLESGTAMLRLVEVPEPEHSVTLRVQVREVDEALRTLVTQGAVELYGKTRTDDLQYVGAVHDPDGHTLILWRDLTEDEYGFTPELPKEMTWDPEAEELLKSLLKHVPALFRGLARRKVTRVVEELASRTRRVGRQEVIRGYILGSAKITRYRLVEPLRAHGIDPDAYREEFEAE